MTHKIVRVARRRLAGAAALALLFAGVLIGCASVGASPPNYLKVGNNDIRFVKITKAAEPVAIKDGKILIAPFEIDLALSDKAVSALKAGGETIVFAFHFYGDPTTPMSDANKKYFSDCYGFSLRREFPVQKRYAIEGLEIPADFYAPLADKDISVNLNIISGRKSSPNNLLSCGILEGRLSELAGRRFFLTGKLIRE